MGQHKSKTKDGQQHIYNTGEILTSCMHFTYLHSTIIYAGVEWDEMRKYSS